VVNYYGATETQQALSYFVVGDDGHRHVVPIGRGVPGVQLLVLTSEGRLAGVGEIGEIVFRSPHLAAGYVGGEDPVRAKFVVNPMSGRAEDRVFRTGDLGRYLPSGDVEFAGRADQQVKIRGFRVELEEIERVLMAQPGVRNVFLDARDDDTGGRTRIIAYVAPASSSPDAGALRQALRRSLPEYSVPSAFVLVEGLPLTPSGKVDKGALPAPAQGAWETSDATPPNGPIEEAVAKVWMEVLGLGEIDATASFFDLGGHSLHATQVVSRLRDILDVDVPIRAIFESPTVAELSRRLEPDDASTESES
jgi:acyl-CoA synthetase (AMP-forming)/AMP-acid ligase II/acyl carrier protein